MQDTGKIHIISSPNDTLFLQSTEAYGFNYVIYTVLTVQSAALQTALWVLTLHLKFGLNLYCGHLRITLLQDGQKPSFTWPLRIIQYMILNSRLKKMYLKTYESGIVS